MENWPKMVIVVLWESTSNGFGVERKIPFNFIISDLLEISLINELSFKT